MSGTYFIVATHPGTMTFILGDNSPYSDEEVQCTFMAFCSNPPDSSDMFSLSLKWTDPDTQDIWEFQLDNFGSQPPLPGSPSPAPPDTFNYVAIENLSGPSRWSNYDGPPTLGTILWTQMPDGPIPFVGNWTIRADVADVPDDDPGGDSITVQFVKVAFVTDRADVNHQNATDAGTIMEAFRRRLADKDQVIARLRRRLTQDRPLRV